MKLEIISFVLCVSETLISGEDESLPYLPVGNHKYNI